MSFKTFATTFFTLCIVTVFNVQAANYYVSPSGINAAGRGTISAPAKTLGYTVNTLIPKVLTEPVVILMAPGDYIQAPDNYPNTLDDAHVAFDTTLVTSATNTITIKAQDLNNRPAIYADTLKLHFIRFTTDYITFDGIQFLGSGRRNSFNTGGLRIDADHITFKKCFFGINPNRPEVYYEGTNVKGFYKRSASYYGNYLSITNCVFYGPNAHSLVIEGGPDGGENIEIINNAFIQRSDHDQTSAEVWRAMAITFWAASTKSYNKLLIWNNTFDGYSKGLNNAKSSVMGNNNNISYNIFNACTIPSDFVLNSLNILSDPLFKDRTKKTAGYTDLNLYLKKYSPGIDGGSPQILDPDGGRSDIGFHGGPEATVRAPHRLDDVRYVDATATTNHVYFNYDQTGAPADFAAYAVHRDPNFNFNPIVSNYLTNETNVSTKQIYDIANAGVTYAYKVNVWDTEELGGGYRTYDIVAPTVTSLVYRSRGTSTTTDDTLTIIFSEAMVDPFFYEPPASDHFVLSGAGSLDGAVVSTGKVVNDNTIIITGFSTDGMLCHGRSLLAFKTSNEFLDYNENVLNQNAALNIDIYNVYNQNTQISYRTLSEAFAPAADNHTIIIMDNGLYAERVTSAKNGITLKSDLNKVAVLDAVSGGSALTITGYNNTISSLKFTGASAGNSGVLVQASASGTVIRNCIAFNSTGNGFSFTGSGTLEHVVSYHNGQSGIVFSGAGTCRNNISANNTSTNFTLNAVTTQAANCTYTPGATDQNYNGWSLNPFFAETSNQWASNYLSLLNNSPCINMADAGVTTDIYGHTRPFAGAADIGAYEVPFNPLTLGGFVLTATPLHTAAGTIITITVTAKDQNSNTFFTYNSAINVNVVGADAPARMHYTGTGLTDAHDGTGSISANNFTNGVYSFQVAYELSGDDIQIRISENQYAITVTGPSLVWDPAGTSYLRVEPGASGQQTDQEVTGVVPTTSGLTMHVSSYDQYDNWIGDVAVSWSQLPGGNLVPATGSEFPTSPVVSYTFAPSPTSQGTQGQIVATLGAFADTSGMISIIATPNKVAIITDPSGNIATEINTTTMLRNDTLVLYAAAYDAANNWIGNLVVDWTAVQSSGVFSLAPLNASSIQFIPTVAGAGYLSITDGTLTDVTGTIVVERGVLGAQWLEMELVGGTNSTTVRTGVGFSIKLTAYNEDSLVATSFDSASALTWRWGALTDTVNENLSSYASKPNDALVAFNEGIVTISGFSLVEIGAAVITVTNPVNGFSATMRIDARDQLGSFVLTATPLHTAAGSNITITVTAKDQNSNTFFTYNSAINMSVVGADAPARIHCTGAGLTYANDGTGSISANNFTNGVYSFQVAYDLSGDDIQIRISESQYAVTATGPTLVWDPAGMSYLRVEPGASGQQTDQEVTGVVPTTSDLTMHASAYDQYDNWIGDVAVSWSQLPGGTLVPATGKEFPTSPVVSYTFAPSPTSRGTQGQIVATLGSFEDRSGMISIVAAPNKIAIITDPSGNIATEFNTITMLLSDTLVLYAAAYDAANQWIGNLVVDWTAVQSSAVFSLAPLNASSMQFIPTATGAGYLSITDGTLTDVTGTIVVDRGILDAQWLGMELVGGTSIATVNTGVPFSIKLTAYNEDSLAATSFDSVSALTWRWGALTDTVNEELSSQASKPNDALVTFNKGIVTVSGFSLVEVGAAVITVTNPVNGFSATMRIDARDGNAPYMLQDISYTRDANGDGRLDQFEVFFNEPLLATLAGAHSGSNGFTITGSNNMITVASIFVVPDTVIASNYCSKVLLICTTTGADGFYDEDTERGEQLTTDTGERPQIEYLPDAGILRDRQGNPASNTPITPLDGAGPVIISAEYLDPTGNYGNPQGDYLELQFSERIVDVSTSLYADDIFMIHGFGNLGTFSRLKNITPDVRITMGSIEAGTLEPIPVVDSITIVNRALSDISGNKANLNNLLVPIHLAPAANLITAFYIYPSPIRLGGDGTSGPIHPSQARNYNLERGALVKYRLNALPEKVTLAVYSLNGRPVFKETFTPGSGDSGAEAGDNYYYWNGYNQRGRIIESGSYILEIKAWSSGKTQRLFTKFGAVK